MKKLLALILAVVMAASLSVVGLAEEGIQPYGGGGDESRVFFIGLPGIDTNKIYSDDEIIAMADIPYLHVGKSMQLALYYCEPHPDRVDPSNLFDERKITLCTGEITWEIDDPTVATVSSTGRVTATSRFPSNWMGNAALAYLKAYPEPGKYESVYTWGGVYIRVLKKGTTDVFEPDHPCDPEDPDEPTTPGNPSGGSSSDKSEPSPTENAANDDKTLDKLTAGESAEVKLVSGSAALSTDTMDALGGHGGKLTVTVDKMTVAIPGGFGKVNEPGRIYYPMDFSDNLANAGDLAAAVKGDKAKTEVVKAGGDMVMPTTVTVTLKTKLTGTVRVYYYNEETRRYTLLASPVAKDGKITFTTKQMGHLVLTTGTI